MGLKRWLAVLLAVVTVLTLVGCTKAPEEEEQTEIAIMREDQLEWKEVEGGVELTAYKGKYKHVRVPEMVAGKYVVSLGTAVVDNDRIVSLVLPTTFEVLDSAWFSGCDKLEQLYGYSVIVVKGDGLELPALEVLQLPSVAQFSSSFVAGCPSLLILQTPRCREFIGYWEDGTMCPWPEKLRTVEMPVGMYARVKAPVGMTDVEGRIWSLVYEPMVGVDDLRYPMDAFRRIPTTAGGDYCTFFGTEQINVNGKVCVPE